jgi:hypothetical protein
MVTYKLQGTHKQSGWTRELILTNGCGTGKYRIVPTDDSGPRVVEFLTAGSWSNNPADNRANIDDDRVVLCDGAELPAWAMDWLTRVNAKSAQRGRDAFQAAMDDADYHAARNEGW